MSYNFKVGDRVIHKPTSRVGYGKGTIQSIKPYNYSGKTSSIAKVCFDIEPADHKQTREIIVDFLTPETTNDSISNKNFFQIGDHVTHSILGKGIVQRLQSSDVAEVLFDNKQIISVKLSDLAYIETEVISDTEVSEDDKGNSLLVIPSNYNDQTCYSTVSKKVVGYLKDKYPSDGFVSVKSYTENHGIIGVITVSGKGIVVFKLIENAIPVDMVASPLFEQMANAQHYYPLKKYYIDKFLQSKKLCYFVDDNNKTLRFPLRFVLLYQNIKLEKKSDIERIKSTLKNRDIFFSNFFSPLDNNDLFSNFENHKQPFEEISRGYFGSILERVIPENATLIQVKPITKRTNSISANPEFHPITGSEREFSALSLDDRQIKSINDTKPGHYLTLANPGTGKSVLLVSKAYRIQSIKNNNHVLITCYNNNLAEHHSIFAEICGLKTKNLHISTFHRLAFDLVGKIDPDYIRSHPYSEESENYDAIIDRFEELVKQGLVQTNLNVMGLSYLPWIRA